MRHFHVYIVLALGCCWGGGDGSEISRNKETGVVPSNEEIDGLQGMKAPKLDKLRLENTYGKQSNFYDGLDHENVTSPHSILEKVEDSEASAVNTRSMRSAAVNLVTERKIMFGDSNLRKAWSLHSVNIA